MGCREEIAVPRGLYEVIPPMIFERYRPTVAVILCVENKLLLVQPARAVDNWFVPPQEGIEYPETPMLTMQRCLKEELGVILPNHALHSAKILGWMENKIPKERVRDGGKTKLITFIGVKCHQVVLRPNPKEISGYMYAENLDEFDEAIVSVFEERLNKSSCVCRAVLRACARGLLSWNLPKELRLLYA